MPTIKPTPKHPDLVALAESLMGNKRDGKSCMACRSDAMLDTDFRDDLSRREAAISCLCQKCQDSIFNPVEDTMPYWIVVEHDGYLEFPITEHKYATKALALKAQAIHKREAEGQQLGYGIRKVERMEED